MPTLFVRCHRCEHEFPSGIAHADGEVGRVELLGVLHRCPRCRDLSRYDTPEYFFPARSEPLPNPGARRRPPETRSAVHDVGRHPRPRLAPTELLP